MSKFLSNLTLNSLVSALDLLASYPKGAMKGSPASLPSSGGRISQEQNSLPPSSLVNFLVKQALTSRNLAGLLEGDVLNFEALRNEERKTMSEEIVALS